MLALSLQVGAALMQRLRPAHFHVAVTTAVVSVPTGPAAGATVQLDRPWSHHGFFSAAADPGTDHENSAANVPRTATTLDRGSGQAHRHAGIGRHHHAGDDPSVVQVPQAEPHPALAGRAKAAFDGFALGLPPGPLLIGQRGHERWTVAMVLGAPLHQPVPPERPPRRADAAIAA